MTSEMLPYALVALVSVFISAVSQTILKKASQKHYDSLWREYLNVRVMGAYALFFIATLLTVLSLRGIPLSLGAMIEGTAYVYIIIFGVVLFKEKLNVKKLIALALILGGIVVYALLG